MLTDLPTSLAITVNGALHNLPPGSTAESLVLLLGLASSPCAVEINKRLIPKRDRPSTPLTHGDTIEIVTLVGGG